MGTGSTAAHQVELAAVEVAVPAEVRIRWALPWAAATAESAVEVPVALAAGFIQEGVERDKFLVAGERVDVLTYGRLVTDPSPATVLLPILV